MNQALREQIRAMAQQAGMETYEGFAGSPDILQFHAEEFERFVHAIQLLIESEAIAAYDRGHDEGYDAGQCAAESQAAFSARNEE
jgi:hypothetical protein